MILRHKNPVFVLGFGQLSLSLGLIGIVLLNPFSGELPRTFLNGFLCGLSYSFLGISVILNIVGLWRIRKG